MKIKRGMYRIYGPDGDGGDPTPGSPLDIEQIGLDFESTSDAKVEISQAQLGKIIGKLRKQSRSASADIAKKVEELTSKLQMTTKEREQLANLTETLRSSHQTEIEKKQLDLTALTQEHEQLRKSSAEEINFWKTQFHGTRMDVDVQEACEKAGVVPGYGIRQVRALLAPQLEVRETVDGKGRGTGKYSTLVKTTNADGDAIYIPITDHLKALDSAGEFPNIFVHSLKSGTGTGGGTGGSGDGEEAPSDPEKLKDYLSDPARRKAFLARPATTKE